MASTMCTSPTRQSLNRKINKPLMEKRRRARINNSLNQLKHLVIDAMKNETTQMSKLEKADILEMTVTFLRNLQCEKNHENGSASKSYSVGYSECAVEVMRVLERESSVSPEVKDRLGAHLRHSTNVMRGQNGTKLGMNRLSIDVMEHNVAPQVPPVVDNRYNYLRLPLPSAHLAMEHYSVSNNGLESVIMNTDLLYKRTHLSQEMLACIDTPCVENRPNEISRQQVRRCLQLSPTGNQITLASPEVGMCQQSDNLEQNGAHSEQGDLNNHDSECVWRPW